MNTCTLKILCFTSKLLWHQTPKPSLKCAFKTHAEAEPPQSFHIVVHPAKNNCISSCDLKLCIIGTVSIQCRQYGSVAVSEGHTRLRLVVFCSPQSTMYWPAGCWVLQEGNYFRGQTDKTCRVLTQKTLHYYYYIIQ